MAEQSGQSIAALQARLSTLANRDDLVLDADRRFAEAVSTAYSITVGALADLARIEAEVEAAVASQHTLSLDTPAGALDLQRFLLSKQREILSVITTANEQAATKTLVVQEILDSYRQK